MKYVCMMLLVVISLFCTNVIWSNLAKDYFITGYDCSNKDYMQNISTVFEVNDTKDISRIETENVQVQLLQDILEEEINIYEVKIQRSLFIQQCGWYNTQWIWWYEVCNMSIMGRGSQMKTVWCKLKPGAGWCRVVWGCVGVVREWCGSGVGELCINAFILNYFLNIFQMLADIEINVPIYLTPEKVIYVFLFCPIDP